MNSRCVKLYRACSISFYSSNVGKFPWSWILKDSIKIQEKKNKVVVLYSRPRKNVKLFALSRRSRATTAKKCTKKRDTRAKLLFRQSKPVVFFAVLVVVAVVVVKPPIVDIEGLQIDYYLHWQQNSLTLYPSRDTLAFVDDHQLIALLTIPWSMRFEGGRATQYGRANGFAQQSKECLKTKKNKNKINGKWHPIGCTVGNVYLIRKTKMKLFIYWSAAG